MGVLPRSIARTLPPALWRSRTASSHSSPKKVTSRFDPTRDIRASRLWGAAPFRSLQIPAVIGDKVAHSSLRASGPTTGDFHDPRDIGRRFHYFACHYHSCRDWEWTDCCGRDVRFGQVASHNRTVSFHHGTH